MAQQNISDPMQRDAVRRMQEMHSKAARQTSAPQQQSDGGERRQAAAESVHQKTPQNSNMPQNGLATELPMSLQELFADRDRNLILIVILLLLGEHSDTSLIMALVYLIL